MKVAVVLLFVVAAASGQFIRPFFPFFPFPYYGLPASDEYAASLGGAKVGLYGRTSGFGRFGHFGFPFAGPFGGIPRIRGDRGVLGGAPVGIYGKDRSGY